MSTLEIPRTLNTKKNAIINALTWGELFYTVAYNIEGRHHGLKCTYTLPSTRYKKNKSRNTKAKQINSIWSLLFTWQSRRYSMAYKCEKLVTYLELAIVVTTRFIRSRHRNVVSSGTKTTKIDKSVYYMACGRSGSRFPLAQQIEHRIELLGILK
jgi:hypothetical protein